MSNMSTFGWDCTVGNYNNIVSINPPSYKENILFQYRTSTNTYCFMPGHSNNGDFYEYFFARMYYYDIDRVTIWTKSPANIYSAHTRILAVYYSGVDDVVYVITSNSTSPYNIMLSKLDKTNGAITNLSTTISIPTISSHTTFSYFSLLQLSSTNLLLISTKMDTAGKIIEFTNTGTVASDTSIIQNGIELFLAVDSNDVPITYRSADGTILAGIRNFSGVGYDNDMLYVARGGAFRIIIDNFRDIISGQLLTLWNDFVVVVGTDVATRNSTRFFVRTDFDRWLSDVCDSVGI